MIHAWNLCRRRAVSYSDDAAVVGTRQASHHAPQADQPSHAGLQSREALSRKSRPGTADCRCKGERKVRRHSGRARGCGSGRGRDCSRATSPIRSRLVFW